jgi:hypothetical protein
MSAHRCCHRIESAAINALQRREIFEQGLMAKKPGPLQQYLMPAQLEV